MFDELQTWWQNITPEMQVVFQNGGLVLVALVGGHFLGRMVTRVLRARNFDAALRLPGSSAPAPAVDQGITATLLVGLLVRLTVWGGAAWWLARQHGRPELASTLGLIINRAWALAAVLVAALALGSLLAQRVIDCIQGSPKAGSEAASSRSLAGAVGAGVYGLVMLLALLIAADMFDWPLTRNSAAALWQLGHNLLIAGAALLIGFLGARWARDLVTLKNDTSPEQRAGQYTALGIVTATTVLAVAVLLSSAGMLLGLAALAILAMALWLGRNHLPDVVAGLQLRAQKVTEVWLDGVAWQVADVGLITTEVTRTGEFSRLQNRLVLEARLHGAPAETSRR